MRRSTAADCRLLPDRPSAMFVIVMVCLSWSTRCAMGEKTRLDEFLIPAEQEVVHYMSGYLVAPGFVDVSTLTFSTHEEDDPFVLLPPPLMPPANTEEGSTTPPPTSQQDTIDDFMGGDTSDQDTLDDFMGGDTSDQDTIDDFMGLGGDTSDQDTVDDFMGLGGDSSDQDTIDDFMGLGGDTSDQDTIDDFMGGDTSDQDTIDDFMGGDTIEGMQEGGDDNNITIGVDDGNSGIPLEWTQAPSEAPSYTPSLQPTGEGGNRHRRASDEFLNGEGNPEEGGIQPLGTKTALDVILFPVPDKCVDNIHGKLCDLTKQGVGVGRLWHEKEELKQWCCTQEALALGLCQEANLGRLILEPFFFHKGMHRYLDIPPVGTPLNAVNLEFGKFEVPEDTGQYVLLMANCNEDYGRNVYVSGVISWKSSFGYLPGELRGAFLYFVCLFLAYVALLVWYAWSMKRNEESTITIQKWILGTIGLGTLEALFRMFDFIIWNQDGEQFLPATYVALVLGVIKRGLSRMLMVMVSMGWGVVRDRLGWSLIFVIILGIIYMALSSTVDVLLLFGASEIETLSTNSEQRIIDVVTVLTFLVTAINFIFVWWILTALHNTMEELAESNQRRKFQLYQRLRCLLFAAVMIALVWLMLFILDSAIPSFLHSQHEWILDHSMQANYWIVLVGVAMLWRPNPNAKEFAYVMEVATDDVLDDLALAETNESGDENDYENEENGERLQVDNAVST